MSEQAPRRHLRVVYADERQDAPAADVRAEADRSRNRRAREVRATTISPRSMTKKVIDVGRAIYPVEDHPALPETRGDCKGGPRPCPMVSCAYNLYLDVTPKTGSVKLNFPDLEVWEMEHSCALDVADRGGTTLEEAGAIMNLTRERIRRVEVKGLAKLKADKGTSELRDCVDECGVAESQLASIMSSTGGAGTSDGDDARTADGDWKPRPKSLFADEGTDEGDAAFVGALYDRALRERGALENGERHVWRGHFLNARQARALDVLPTFFAEHGRGPTFRELADALEINGASVESSIMSARATCLALREIGAVEWSRSTGVVLTKTGSVPVDGSVSQGGPESSTASEKQEEKAMRKRGEVRDGMIAALREGPHTRAELAQKLGISDAHVGATLTRLRLAGEAVRCDDGKWTAGAGAGSTKPKAVAPKRSAGAPATRPKPARKPSPTSDPIVVQLRERLEQIDQQRAPIVAALRAFGEEVA